MFETRVMSGALTESVGKTVHIAGWVHAVRKMGKILFLDLRDAQGLVQVVITPDDKELFSQANDVRPEWVLGITGEVRERGAKHVNKNIASGTVEVVAQSLTVLNESITPPFEIDDRKNAGEEIRLTYRYLDLRRERMRRNIHMRHDIVKYIRDFLSERDFVEIETPILTKGTPEGAREYIVPARLYHGYSARRQAT